MESGKILRLKAACEDDCILVWKWVNDPDVRAVSFCSEPIFWKHHVQWFKSKIIDPHCLLYIGINSNNVPIGQIRYDIKSNEAVVSISINHNFRNQGYGSRLIALGCKQLFHDSLITKINAYIKLNNQASIRSFCKAGFQSRRKIILQGQQAIYLVLDK